MRSLRVVVTAALSACALCAISASAQAVAPLGAYTTNGTWKFTSAPNLHPPRLHTARPTNFKALVPGFIFAANFPNLTRTQPTSGTPELMVGQSGPYILDTHLRPVWFNPVPTNVVALDLKRQTYQGNPALSWWQGVINNAGVALSGKLVVVNQQYRRVATLVGQQGWTISPHEVLIQGGSAWVTAYKDIPGKDLTGYSGPAKGVVNDSAVQKYDLKTGKLIYNWDALQHIPLSESQTKPAKVAPPVAPSWDAYHVNSIQLVSGGKFLVSMRNTWAGYLVDIKTGSIIWKLGGKNSSFVIPAADQFQWQHDIELHAHNVVSVYDDACCAFVPGKGFVNPSGPSRGLLLGLNLTSHTASAVAQYNHGSNFHAAFLGNTQLLPNGNVMVGWGSLPFFSEFSKSGKFLLDVFWPGPDLSYRVFVQNWVGKPFYRPGAAVRKKHGKATVFASWDGATHVSSWRVLAGPNAKHLATVAVRRKTGFETAIRLGHTYRAYKVQALDSKGHMLRATGVFPKLHGPSTSLPQGY
jgi:hypothetical protein